MRRRLEAVVRVALQHLAEHGTVEGEVPGLLLRHLLEDGAQLRVVLRHQLPGLGVRPLGGPLLHRRIDEHAVGVLVPVGVEPRPHVLELHLLQATLVQQAGIPHVVVQHLPVPVLFGGPEVQPVAPVAVLAGVGREHPVEMGESLFREEVQRHRGAGRDRDPLGPLLGLLAVVLDGLVRAGADEVVGKPEGTLRLVGRHQLADGPLEVPEDLELGDDVPRGVTNGHGSLPALPARNEKEPGRPRHPDSPN